MTKTRDGHSSNYRPRVRPSSPALAIAPPPATPGLIAAPDPVAPAMAATTGPAAASDPATLVQRRYKTRVGPTPPSPPHPDHPGGPRLQKGLGLQVRANPLAHGLRSTLHHHHRVQFLTFLRMSLLDPLSDDLSSNVAPF